MLTGLLHLEYTAGHLPRRSVIAPSRVGGGAFLQVNLRLPIKGTQKMQQWLVHRIAKKMNALGVRRLVPPKESFPFWNILEQHHIYAVSSRRLLWYLAVPITLFFFTSNGKNPEKQTVLLQGERMHVEVERIAKQLCTKVRNVAFQVPGSKSLEGKLRMWYGLPAFKGPAAFEQASLVLLCSASLQEETVVPGRGALFYFGDGDPKLCTERCKLKKVAFRLKNRELLPDCWEETALITALWEMGCLPLEELEIIQLS